jgi:iron complex transport system substrate-binding protein
MTKTWLKVAALVLCLFSVVHAAPAALPRQRIADAWFAHNAVLVMLGASDQVVATVAKPKALPWMFKVAPGLTKAQGIDGSTMNAEELLRLRADVVFVTPTDPTAAALANAGLDVVKVSFNDIQSFVACLELTADTLATPRAREQVVAYRKYLADTLADVTRRLPADKPTVLHINSLNPLKVDGGKTIIDQWIVAAGGRNATTGLDGNMQAVSIEQVLAWNPQVIIIAAGAGDLASSPQAGLWKQLAAVREGRVHRNPMGVFPWDRYGPELPLQVRWAEQVIHGGKVDEGDMAARTKAFYKTFYAYDLNDADALRILRGEPPAP